MQDIDAYAKSYSNQHWLKRIIKSKGDKEHFVYIEARLQALVEDATLAITADMQSQVSEIRQRLSGAMPYVVSVWNCLDAVRRSYVAKADIDVAYANVREIQLHS